MRLIDADAFVKRHEDWLKSEMKKDGHTDYQSGYMMGVRATLFELADERFTPTVEVRGEA